MNIAFAPYISLPGQQGGTLQMPHPLLLSRAHWTGLLLATSLLLLALLWPVFSGQNQTTESAASTSALPQPLQTTTPDIEALSIATPAVIDTSPTPQQHTIASGDTLQAIFQRYEIGASTLSAIMQADEDILALDVLHPDSHLIMEKTPRGELQRLTLELDPGRILHYERSSEGHFSYAWAPVELDWQARLFRGEISGSFYQSALRAGLSDQDAMNIAEILQQQLNFRRDLQAGDQFAVIRGEERNQDTPTGRTRLEAIRLQRGNREYTAFLFSDGSFYDAEGNSLTPAFLRLPSKQPYRISSAFNLARRHPITRRVAPHNGVDFAMPVGTPVLTTGDGIVSRTGNHPYAGKYVEIEHQGAFKTRYLHLHRIEVRRGQQVERGQRIAQSGNTGRTSGPHLHYELHINGRPVDPMTADIPEATSIPDEQLGQFRDQVETTLAVMTKHANETLVASLFAPTEG
ncbi:MAG: hypothetical protein EA348_12590 [Pseudomonadaceae bacterium]|nr:MAG: hypothetical protein EA348_12590 [Pseudomonadaceae bacterium]